MESLCVMKKCVTELMCGGELTKRRLEPAGYLDCLLGRVNGSSHLKVVPRVLAERVDQLGLEADTAESQKRIENCEGRHFSFVWKEFIPSPPQFGLEFSCDRFNSPSGESSALVDLTSYRTQVDDRFKPRCPIRVVIDRGRTVRQRIERAVTHHMRVRILQSLAILADCLLEIVVHPAIPRMCHTG